MVSRTSTTQGFTLIELLLTIGLITLLSGAVLTATGASRTEAKNVKVKSNIVEVQRSLASHDVSAGGYPNPNPGVKKLYCIGGTKCKLNGQAVASYLNPVTGDASDSTSGQSFVYSEFISMTDAEGDVTAGIMYLSCGLPGDICPDPESVHLIYPQSTDAYSETLITNATPINIDPGELGITEDSYTVVGGGDQGGGDGIPPQFNTYCGWPEFSNDNFQYGTGNHCIYIEGDYGGEYWCDMSCWGVVAAVFPYANCSEYEISSQNTCVFEYGEAGINYYRCQSACDYNPD